jgi:hypothetical protein
MSRRINYTDTLGLSEAGVREKQRENLSKLIVYLKYIATTEPEVFDLSEWFTAKTRVDAEHAMLMWPGQYAKGEKLNCGTAACLVGHLPVAFPDDWRYEIHNGTNVEIKWDPLGYDYISDTLCQFFGGDRGDSQWETIIYTTSYPDQSRVTIDQVIDRIEALYEELYGDN